MEPDRSSTELPCQEDQRKGHGGAYGVLTSAFKVVRSQSSNGKQVVIMVELGAAYGPLRGAYVAPLVSNLFVCRNSEGPVSVVCIEKYEIRKLS